VRGKPSGDGNTLARGKGGQLQAGMTLGGRERNLLKINIRGERGIAMMGGRCRLMKKRNTEGGVLGPEIEKRVG